MNRFSIKDIEALTGIKPHTLRIWEQRYNLIKPQRTSTNIRFYSDDDLRLLLNVAFLNKQGLKISKISEFSKEQMNDIIHRQIMNGAGQDYMINVLLSCMLNLDEEGFSTVFDRSVLDRGMQNTMEELVFPFLDHIGILWQAGTVNPGYEHFISNLVKSKIILATAQVAAMKRRNDPKRFVLWLPDGESHEIGLLFANYLVRREGHESIYLGQNMPCSDLKAVIQAYRAPYLFSSLVMSKYYTDADKLIMSLSKTFPEQEILITGQGFLKVPQEQLPGNVSQIKDCNDFLEILA